MLPLVFAHANSFSAGTYRLLFEALKARHIDVSAPDLLGHDPRFTVQHDWQGLVAQLAEFVQTQVEQHGEPVFLAGHSLGGLLSVMVAAQHPSWVRGVLLIDSPLLGGWRARGFGWLKKRGWAEQFSPGKISRQRRFNWPSKADAHAHFLQKPLFARFHPQVLADYIDSGLEAVPAENTPSQELPGTASELADRGFRLRFRREVETAIYNSLPHDIEQLLLRQPLRCPCAFIGGTQSAEMRQVGKALTLRVVQGRVMMLNGGHLFPMEQPEATAAAIEASLLNLQSLRA